MYREELKVLDCTIRDGSLINNNRFTYEFVKAIYAATAAAGADYMEIGKNLCTAISLPVKNLESGTSAMRTISSL